eukprot:CAMPEP_0183791814 /NCGR_PEP_ID=MMETSP0803_2-20130417/2128_1 /TAXON_ID=195967 /ORGANISM="Crustomastix stigmata, Strain CCMP3273" /LENGTH=411 /DNA_ID=CAMNT_0026036147 /DNA_START=58 /DNA_END=1290 /DNA_ORIENTATION=+
MTEKEKVTFSDGAAAGAEEPTKPLRAEVTAEGIGLLDQQLSQVAQVLTTLDALKAQHDGVVKEQLRRAGQELRPICDVTKLLDLQKIIDDVRLNVLESTSTLMEECGENLGAAYLVVRNIKNMQVVLKRFTQREMARAFATWRDAVLAEEMSWEERFKHPKVQQLLRKALGTQLSASFDTWTWHTQEAKEKKQVEMLEYQRYQKAQQDAAAMAAELEALKERRMKEVLTRFLQRDLALAFNKWRDVWEEANKERLLGEEERRRNELLRELEAEKAGWASERAAMERRLAIEAEKAAQAEELKMKRIADVLKRIMHKELMQAWTAWMEVVEAKRRVKYVMRKMLNSKLSQSFARWLDFVEEAQEMEGKLRRAAQKMMNRQLSQCFERWADAAQEAKETRVKLERCMRKMMNA